MKQAKRRQSVHSPLQLNTLRAEFDANFDRMQEPGMGAAMGHAFGVSPEELGRSGG